jgi:hypothetical protein
MRKLRSLAAALLFVALAANAESTCKKCTKYGTNSSAWTFCERAAHMENGSTTCSSGWLDNDGTAYLTDDCGPKIVDVYINQQWRSIACECFALGDPCGEGLMGYPTPEACRKPCLRYEQHCHGFDNCSTYDPQQEGDGSPILINMGRGAWDISGVDDAVPFNMYGAVERWTWPRGQLAFLAHDRDGNGIITGGHEIYGDWTPRPADRATSNGFVWLRGYDDNRDGLISAEDGVWQELLLWRDNSPRDGASQPSELMTIAGSGIEWISLDYHFTGRHDTDGNRFRLQALIKIDGRIEPIYDVYFRRAP